MISSVDVGIRKPTPAIFEAACAAVGVPSAGCVMIGNSERNDIEPAVAMGMRTIRVAIEEPRRPQSAAHVVATCLDEVKQLLIGMVDGLFNSIG